jgi:prenylcysteine oxidase/farnesylcysteine lyase
VLDDLGGSWWSSARLFWRYGYSPITTKNLVTELKDKFLRLYDPAFLHRPKSSNATESGYPWGSIEKMAKHLNLSDSANADAQSWFYGKGVSQLFIQELIEAASRVNYGQNTDSIHALGAGVSLAASGAAGIKGGNHRVFEEMIARSDARVHLGERGEVTGLVKYDSKSLLQAFAAGELPGVHESEVTSSKEGSTKWWVGTAAGGGGLFDAVFIGTPWHAGGITLLNTEATIPVNKYVHLHVTVLATNASHPSSQYFGRTQGSDVPKAILTTYEAVRKADAPVKPTADKKWYHFGGSSEVESATAKRPELEFTSLTYMSTLPARSSSAAQDHLVKIFSLQPLSDEKLDELIGAGTIGWVYRQEWDAYPELHPTSVFPPITPDEGLYYLNAMEPLISTMETSTVSSRNAVALALEKWLGLDFVVGTECNFSTGAFDDADDESWDGWGCHSG